MKVKKQKGARGTGTGLSTYAAVAAAAGCGRNTVLRAMAVPGAPEKRRDGTWARGVVVSWVKKNLRSPAALAARDTRLADLRREEIALRVEAARRENAVAAGKLIEREKAMADFAEILAVTKQGILAFPAEMAAPFGEAGPEMQKHGTECAHALIERIREWLEERGR